MVTYCETEVYPDQVRAINNLVASLEPQRSLEVDRNDRHFESIHLSTNG